MAWGWLQSAAGNNGTGAGTVAATYATANLSSGTKLIALVTQSGAVALTVSGVALSGGGTFTLMATAVLAGNAGTNGLSLWQLDTPAGAAGTKPTVTATISGGTPEAAILVQEVSGLVTGTTVAAVVDGTPGTLTGNTNTATGSPSYTSTAASEFLLACYGDTGGPLTFTKPAALTADTANVNSSAANDVALAYGNSTNGTEAGSWGLSGTATPWGVLLLAFKLAAGAAAATYTPQRYGQPAPPWAPQQKPYRSIPGAVDTPANPLVSPLDSAWQADAGYWHLYGDSALRDRRQCFQQRPYVSQPGLLTPPGNLDPVLAAWADTERRYLTAAYWDRREYPQQKDMRDANPLGTAAPVIDPTTSAAADRVTRYGVAATHADRREVPQQRAYPDRQPGGSYTAGAGVVQAWWGSDDQGWYLQRAYPDRQPGAPDVQVGSGVTEAWWGIAPEPYQAGQRLYVSDPSFYPAFTVPPSPLDTAWQAGGAYWHLYNRAADITDRREVPQQRPYVSDPSLLIPPAATDPTLSAWLPLWLAYSNPAVSTDRREAPQQRPCISDPSFYPATAPADALTIAWGAGGPYWHLYNRAADLTDRRLVPQQRPYVSDALLLTTALLENELLGGSGTWLRYSMADWLRPQSWPAWKPLVSDPSLGVALLDPTQSAWLPLWLGYNLAATHADRREVPQQRQALALLVPPVPLDPVQSAWLSLWLAYNLAATHYDRRQVPAQWHAVTLVVPLVPLVTYGTARAGSSTLSASPGGHGPGGQAGGGGPR